MQVIGIFHNLRQLDFRSNEDFSPFFICLNLAKVLVLGIYNYSFLNCRLSEAQLPTTRIMTTVLVAKLVLFSGIRTTDSIVVSDIHSFGF